MTSRLAKSTIEQLKSEGLNPSFEDIIKLNALGLKVERGSESFNFSSVPRVSFLGDFTLWEPTIGKRIWIDTARQLIQDNITSQIYFLAYALNCPSCKLPELDDTKKLKKEVEKFRDEVLINFTETQILYAIDYCLEGNDSIEGEDYVDEEQKSVIEIPKEVSSMSNQLLCEALSYGIDIGVKDHLTIPQLDKLIIHAALHNGVDVLKNEHTRNAALFYKCVG